MPNDNGNFAGRVAFVTGAATGIGRAAALAFASKGASVVAADLSEQGNQETARRIEKAGGRALAVKCDVSRAALEKAAETFGRLDFAFNNAGVEQPITNTRHMGRYSPAGRRMLTMPMNATKKKTTQSVLLVQMRAESRSRYCRQSARLLVQAACPPPRRQSPTGRAAGSMTSTLSPPGHDRCHDEAWGGRSHPNCPQASSAPP